MVVAASCSPDERGFAFGIARRLLARARAEVEPADRLRPFEGRAPGEGAFADLEAVHSAFVGLADRRPAPDRGRRPRGLRPGVARPARLCRSPDRGLGDRAGAHGDRPQPRRRADPVAAVAGAPGLETLVLTDLSAEGTAALLACADRKRAGRGVHGGRPARDRRQSVAGRRRRRRGRRRGDRPDGGLGGAGVRARAGRDLALGPRRPRARRAGGSQGGGRARKRLRAGRRRRARRADPGGRRGRGRRARRPGRAPARLADRLRAADRAAPPCTRTCCRTSAPPRTPGPRG